MDRLAEKRSSTPFTELNSTVLQQVTSQFEGVVKILVLCLIAAFCPGCFVTFRGHCRNAGTDLRPNAYPGSVIQ